MIYETLIPRHRIEQPATARDAPIRAIDETHGEGKSQDRRRRAAARCLKNELGDGHIGGRGQHRLRVCDAE